MKFYTDCTLQDNKILLRGYENGRRFNEKIEDYQPYLFMKSNIGNYKTIHGQTIQPINFKSLAKARAFIYSEKEKNASNLFGLSRFEYLYLYDNYLKDGFQYDVNLLRIFYIDIETTSINGVPDINDPFDTLTAITIYDNKNFITFGLEYYKPKSDDHIYVLCKDEEELLLKFIDFWSDDYPDILTGWNSQGFDMAYLVARIKRVFGVETAKRLSPWNILRKNTLVFNGKDVEVEEPLGICQLDYFRLYKKFRLILRESYKLDYISQIELGEKKVDYSEFGTIRNLHERNYELFIDYNKHDVQLVKNLDKKFGYINLAVSIAFMAGCNFYDAFGSVVPWDCFIHHKLLNKNIVVPFGSIDGNEDSIVGGFVKEPQKGKHEWVVSLDLDGLYPHIIMLCNIGPDTFYKNISKNSLDENIKTLINETMPYDEKYCLTGNYCLYSKQKQSFFSQLMEEVYENRKSVKKEMLALEKQYEETKKQEYKDEAIQKHSIQYALKIFGNSGYGTMANKYFRYYNSYDAEAVTATGQAAIQYISKKLNEFLNKTFKTNNFDYVIYIDTDSCHLNLKNVVDLVFDKPTDNTKIVNFIDKFVSTNIQPVINKTCEDFAKNINAFKPKLKMKQEKIISSAVYVAKKKYVLDVWDDEGVRFKEPQVKVTGLEVVRSSTPDICRKKLKEAYTIVLRNDEKAVQKLVKEFRNEFFQAPIVDISFPRGLNDYDKWTDTKDFCKKGTPIHVRGAIFFNMLVDKLNISKDYPYLSNREKVKFIYLKEPNPLGTYVMSFRDVIPSEFQIDKYIDKTLQFEKAFLQPLQTLLKVIGWSYEKQSNLQNLFTFE